MQIITPKLVESHVASAKKGEEELFGREKEDDGAAQQKEAASGLVPLG